jgi:hypothetical protein
VAVLTVKALPDAIYEQLKEAARAEGRSLNAYVIALFQASVEEQNRRRRMREKRGEFRRFLETLPAMDDSTPLIREDRDRGH